MRVAHEAGESTFRVTLDTKEESDAARLNLVLRGKLIDYPDSKPLDLPFIIIIQQAVQFDPSKILLELGDNKDKEKDGDRDSSSYADGSQ